MAPWAQGLHGPMWFSGAGDPWLTRAANLRALNQVSTLGHWRKVPQDP